MTRIAAVWVGSILFAGLALWCDVHLNFRHQAFARSGAVITCLSVFIPLITVQHAEALAELDKATDQLLRHYRLATATERDARRFLKVNRWSNIALAVGGTLIWGFGDLMKMVLGS